MPNSEGRKTAPQRRYDSTTRRLHWATAMLVLLMWGGAHAIDWFPRGPIRVDARSVHIAFGVLLVVLTAYRLYWRRTHGVVFVRTVKWWDRAATLIHGLLYVAIITTLGLGLANTSVRGDSLFSIAQIPSFGSYGADQRHALSEQLTNWHQQSANAILLVALVHASAALVHHFLLRDDLLARMLRNQAN
ncbi:MAG: cytochrome b/b6 domain-containing protein [Novosphingobium sp.]